MARLNLSISDQLNAAIIKSAKMLDRSRAYIAREAIKYYFEEVPQDIEDAEIALARMNDKNMKYYTSEEFEELLKKKYSV